MRKNILISVAGLALAAGGLVFLLLLPIDGDTKADPPVKAPVVADKSSSSFFGTAEPFPARSVGVPAESISWEQRLEDILNAPGEPDARARALLNAMSGLPVEAQELFTAEAIEISRGGDFSDLAAVYFRAGTPRSVALEIFDEALDRPNAVKLPFLAETADQSNHPLAGEARDLLALYMEIEPDSVSPGSWDAAVKDYLRENP